jgi:hypothetical protein
MIAALLLAAALASAGAEPPKVSALDEAASFCQWQISGKDGKFNMPAGSVRYENWGADVVALMKSKRIPVGPTFADLPELVVRFASTQPAGRLSGMSPEWFGYMSFGRGKAWTVNYPKTSACDVMVTGSAEYLADRDSLLEKMQKGGWKLFEAPAAQNSPLWRSTLSKPGDTDGSNIVATVQGLSPDLATPDGVQLEIQFIRSVGPQ